MHILSKEKIEELAEKKLCGNITTEENELLQQFLNCETTDDVLWISSDTDEAALRARLLTRIKNSASIDSKIPVYRLASRWAAAAILVIIATGFIYYYTQRNTITTNQTQVATNVQSTGIQPGVEGAILTLANGEKIILDKNEEGRIAQQGEMRVTNRDGMLHYDLVNGQKTKAGENAITFNTVATTRGRQFSIRLSDGTRVWLNATTQLTYPTAFAGNERKVYLSGEAYFEVAKNKASPFRIIINKTDSVEVLGTHFNICAYAEEAKNFTTLLEGSVKMNNQFILKPGQQFQATTGKKYRIATVDTAAAVAWKNGLFVYNDADIATMMAQFSRWYDLDIVFRGAPVTDRFTGVIRRNVQLDTALKVLKYSKIDFKIEGRTLIVSHQ